MGHTKKKYKNKNIGIQQVKKPCSKAAVPNLFLDRATIWA